MIVLVFLSLETIFSGILRRRSLIDVPIMNLVSSSSSPALVPVINSSPPIRAPIYGTTFLATKFLAYLTKAFVYQSVHYLRWTHFLLYLAIPALPNGVKYILNRIGFLNFVVLVDPDLILSTWSIISLYISFLSLKTTEYVGSLWLLWSVTGPLW